MKARRAQLLAGNPFPDPLTLGFFYREKLRAIHEVAPDGLFQHVLEIGGGRGGVTGLLYPQARVVNLELRDESGFCRFALWDDDVGLVERGKAAVGATVRALDCYVKRTNFGLDVSRGKFGALVIEGR